MEVNPQPTLTHADWKLDSSGHTSTICTIFVPKESEIMTLIAHYYTRIQILQLEDKI